MSPLRLAGALAATCASISAYGVVDTLLGVLVLGLLIFFTRAVRGSRDIRRALCSDVAVRAVKWADWIVAAMAAGIGGKAARDIARESSAILDDMAADNQSPTLIVVASITMALKLPGQIRCRSASSALLDEASSKEEGRIGPIVLTTGRNMRIHFDQQVIYLRAGERIPSIEELQERYGIDPLDGTIVVDREDS